MNCSLPDPRAIMYWLGSKRSSLSSATEMVVSGKTEDIFDLEMMGH